MIIYKAKTIIKDKSLERKEFVLYNDALKAMTEMCKKAIACGADKDKLLKSLNSN